MFIFIMIALLFLVVRPVSLSIDTFLHSMKPIIIGPIPTIRRCFSETSCFRAVDQQTMHFIFDFWEEEEVTRHQDCMSEDQFFQFFLLQIFFVSHHHIMVQKNSTFGSFCTYFFENLRQTNQRAVTVVFFGKAIVAILPVRQINETIICLSVLRPRLFLLDALQL